METIAVYTSGLAAPDGPWPLELGELLQRWRHNDWQHHKHCPRCYNNNNNYCCCWYGILCMKLFTCLRLLFMANKCVVFGRRIYRILSGFCEVVCRFLAEVFDYGIYSSPDWVGARLRPWPAAVILWRFYGDLSALPVGPTSIGDRRWRVSSCAAVVERLYDRRRCRISSSCFHTLDAYNIIPSDVRH